MRHTVRGHFVKSHERGSGDDGIKEFFREKRRTQRRYKASDKMLSALKVVAFDKHIRAWLEANDPMALKQVLAALADAEEGADQP